MTVNCIAGRGTGTRGESRESVSERRRERTGLCGPYVIALFASLLCYFAWRRPCRPRTRALGRGSGLSFLALPRPRRYLLYMRFTTVSTRQTSHVRRQHPLSLGAIHGCAGAAHAPPRVSLSRSVWAAHPRRARPRSEAACCSSLVPGGAQAPARQETE